MDRSQAEAALEQAAAQYRSTVLTAFQNVADVLQALYYDAAALDAAWELVKDWTADERQQLREAVPRTALATPFRRSDVRDVARRVLTIADGGLQRRRVLDAAGRDERVYLARAHALVESGRTAADDVLAQFNGAWRGDVAHAFRELKY